ncbi:serine hydrolase [Pleionea sp. CnH1-48]|uniref:serine hydrolase domain-containing protein n=1 Tax=Pleionea sp. CnH1-48 TaxID=2954494 RepID=UPI002097F1B7|nr:serine hydrolase domain-containing protein [Pleionea sp. CnH1-48]
MLTTFIKGLSVTQQIQVLIFCIALFSITSCANEGSISMDSYIQSEMKEFLAEENAQVASVVIVNHGKTYQYHFGELDNGRKPNNQTIYELASITKTYVGLLLAKAVLDNKVDIDIDIRRYLSTHTYSNLSLASKPITLRHLATHLSGLPKDLVFNDEDVRQGRVLEKMSNYSKEQFFNDLSKIELLSVPGEEYRYSSAGTKLIAYILESVYNQPLDSLLAEYIMAQSGETNTKFQYIERGLDDVVKGRNQTGDVMPLLSPYSRAGGGLTSSIESMTHYINYQLTSKNPEVALSHTFLAGNKSGNGRAYLWNTYQYDSDNPMLYHSGGSLGTSSWLALYPKRKIGVFIVTNLSANDTQSKLNMLSNDIVKQLFYNA